MGRSQYLFCVPNLALVGTQLGNVQSDHLDKDTLTMNDTLATVRPLTPLDRSCNDMPAAPAPIITSGDMRLDTPDANAGQVTVTTDAIIELLETAGVAPTETTEDRERVSLHYADAAVLADLLADELTRLSVAALPDYPTTAPGCGQ